MELAVATAGFDVAAILVEVECRRETELVVADHNCLLVDVKVEGVRIAVVERVVEHMVMAAGCGTLVAKSAADAAGVVVGEVVLTHISNCSGELEHAGCMHQKTVVEEGVAVQHDHLSMTLQAKEVTVAQEDLYAFCSVVGHALVWIVQHTA